MDIYVYINQKQRAALKGENIGIKFPYLNKIKKSSDIDKIMKKIYLN